MICYLCYPAIQLVIWIVIPNSFSLDMTSAPRQGSRLAPPHIVISLSAPPAEVPLIAHPQAVAIEEAVVDNNNSTLKYWIKAEDFPEVAANTVVVVDAQTQYSRPSSRPGSAVASPNPLIGIWIASMLEGVITEVTPVYQAP